MRHLLRVVFLSFCLAAACIGRAGAAADSPEARQQAAERLFDLPAYRRIASRQVYDAMQALPEGQYRSAVDALSDPGVVKALRAVIVRSMAQTFTVPEMESLARYLSTLEARSAVDKADAFQNALLRELLAAALANPELGRLLAPR
jgi:hypothetical protein